jgi:GR25 family glycosyltransferase involved in LPS biosynthesis
MMDATYCINLDRRTDRWNDSCVPQFRAHGIHVERVSGVDGKLLDFAHGAKYNGRIGCTMSHLKVLKLAKNLGKKDKAVFLILEDDVLFTCENIVAELSTKMIDVPENWDMVFLGANHLIPPKNMGNGIIKLIKSYTTHAYMVNSSFLDELIDLLETHINRWTTNKTTEYHNAAVDVLYSNLMSSKNVYGFQKTLSTQIQSYSDIECRNVNYTSIK